MNIFWLSPDLEEACRWHVDTHVVKMPLEHCQLLSTAIHLSTTKVSPETKIYKPTHANHPCSIWARESLDNWLLLRDFTELLCKEYSHRYRKIHACLEVVENLPTPNLPRLGVTDLPLAMRHLFRWKNRRRPSWTLRPNSHLIFKKAPS
jgi:hypothetical protein